MAVTGRDLKVGMEVITPLGRPAAVIKTEKSGGDSDAFERVRVRYTDTSDSECSYNLVTLQPKLLRIAG